MKNYIVKAMINFNDTQEKDKDGNDTPREKDKSIWYCDKERYEFLNSKGAVMLMGIDEFKSRK